MGKARLVIATSVRANDAYCAQVTIGYSESVSALRSLLSTTEIAPVTVSYGVDNIRARNRIAALTLRDFPDMTHVLWWDDDQWPDDVRIVPAMLSTGEDVIGAAYTNKGGTVRWVHQELYSGPTSGVVREVRCLGMGFTITSRRAIEKLSETTDTYWDAPKDHTIPNIFGLLYETVPDGRRILLSEDYSFCKRWRDSGGRCMVYMGGNVIHAGSRGYSGKDVTE